MVSVKVDRCLKCGNPGNLMVNYNKNNRSFQVEIYHGPKLKCRVKQKYWGYYRKEIDKIRREKNLLHLPLKRRIIEPALEQPLKILENIEWQLDYVPINSLVKHPALRHFDFENKEKLKVRIARHFYDKQFPITVSKLGNGKYEILDGFHRFLACKELYYKQIWARLPTRNLTEQEKCFMIAESNTQKEFTSSDWGQLFYFELEKRLSYTEIAALHDVSITFIKEACALYHAKIFYYNHLSKDKQKLVSPKKLYNAFLLRTLPLEAKKKLINDLLDAGKNIETLTYKELSRLMLEAYRTGKSVVQLFDELRSMPPTQVVLKRSEFKDIFDDLFYTSKKAGLNLHKLMLTILKLGYREYKKLRETS